MPRALDLSKLDPKRAARILANREAKKREYQRRREVPLARQKAWHEANPDKAKAIHDAWRAAHPERVAELKRQDYERHRPQRLAAQAERYENLSDACVRAAVAHRGGVSGLTSRDVPDEVLPLFRTQLLIRRELRSQKAKP